MRAEELSFNSPDGIRDELPEVVCEPRAAFNSPDGIPRIAEEVFNDSIYYFQFP